MDETVSSVNNRGRHNECIMFFVPKFEVFLLETPVS